MTGPSRNADSQAADPRGVPAAPPRISRVRPYALDIITIGQNVFATASGFLVLMFAPWICLYTLLAVREDAIGSDEVANSLILASLEEIVAHAAVGAALFLVIGVILQTWYYIRPFPSRRPAVLAFPIAWALLLPEALLRGGSVISGVVVGAAIALAFAAHWGMLMLLNDLRE